MNQAIRELPSPRAKEAKVEFSDAAASENKSLPVHRWVPWIAGFSANFVEDAIDAYLPKRNRDRQLILDPFAGVGTTLVEALKAGCPTTGFEINPFAALAARVSTLAPPRRSEYQRSTTGRRTMSAASAKTAVSMHRSPK